MFWQNLLDSCAAGAKLSYLWGQLQFYPMGLGLGYNTQFPISVWVLTILFCSSFKALRANELQLELFEHLPLGFLSLQAFCSFRSLGLSLPVSTVLKCVVGDTKRRIKCHKTSGVHNYINILKLSWYAAKFLLCIQNSQWDPWARNRVQGIWITRPRIHKSSSVVCKLICDQVTNTALGGVFMRNAKLRRSE